MLEGVKKYGLFFLFLILLSINVFIFHLDWKSSYRKLTFAVLDVGQGDALFIESPTGVQILVDGGPPKKIISQLARVMSPFDKSIDAIIVSNPDQDHMAGFLDVLKLYDVKYVFEPGTFNESKTYQNFQDEIIKKNITKFLAQKGMKLDLGGGVFIDILFPDRDVSNWERNDGSIVARLSYGENSVMLTGDSTTKTEKLILGGGKNLKSTILKVGHHGSRTSTGEAFVKAVDPIYAVISNGKDNKYGHPHKETLFTLDKMGVKVLRTDLLGTIIFSCDRMNLCETN